MINNIFQKVRKFFFPVWSDRFYEILNCSSEKVGLHLGCGSTKIQNFVNVDKNPNVSPNIIWDLNHYPLPFNDDTFEIVIAISIIEHLDNFFSIMGEIHRVTKKNGIVLILVPHFSSLSANTDPTHRQNMSIRSCDYFIQGTGIEKEYGFYVPFRYNLLKRYISLHGIFKYIPLLNFFVGHFPVFWEGYLCYLIRGEGIFWELEVLKHNVKTEL